MWCARIRNPQDDGVSYKKDVETKVGDDSDGQPRATSQCTMSLMTVSFFGICFSWMLETGYATPAFLELGMSKALVSFTWLAGPITGIVVQPLVGAWSDRCTHKWGRRRPFMLLGLCFLVAGLILFANAESIGLALGDTHGNHTLGIIVACMAFWIMDCSLNAAQGPARTVIGDIVPPQQHSAANAWLTFHLGAGQLAAAFLGSLNLAAAMPGFVTNLRALYTLGAIVVIITLGLGIVAVKETPLRPEDAPEDKSVLHIARDIRDALRTMPLPMSRAFIVQSFSWVGWFSFFIYSTSWVGASVYGGVPEAPIGDRRRTDYDEGVRMGNFGYALNSATILISSSVVPSMINWLGYRKVYALGQLVFTWCLLSTVWIRTPTAAVFCIAVSGFSFAITMIVPWVLTSQSIRGSNDEGVFMAAMNLSQCFPQIVAAGLGEVILHIFPDKVEYCIAMGGIFAFIGLLFVPRIVTQEEVEAMDAKQGATKEGPTETTPLVGNG